MHPKIIGITGRKFSGKDTSGEFLVKNFGYERIAFADALKEGIKLIFGFSNDQVYGNKKEEKDDFWGISPREVLQFFGTEVFRTGIKPILPNIGEDFWISVVKRKIENRLKENPDSKFVITDVRFSNEVNAIKQMGGIIIRVERNNIENNSFSNHPSEMQIDNLVVDYNIKNNSTKELLYINVDSIINK
jgi:hypothetical protein